MVSAIRRFGFDKNIVTIQATVRTLRDLSKLVVQNNRRSRTKASGR
jgi:hypothetical protein